MSAYVHSDSHFNALVTFLANDRLSNFYYDQEGVQWDMRDDETRQHFAQLIKNQNIKSVMIRYPQDTLETLPGPNDLKQEIEYRHVGGYQAIEILKGCDSYDYQSCEDPHYYLTPAAHFVDAVRRNAIHRMPQYEKAKGWDL